MAENKTKQTQVSVPAFIETLTDATQKADAKELVKLLKTATGEKPKMWGPSIIGFGSRHYKYESGREGDTPLICFAPRKSGTVLYLAGLGDAKDLLKKLGKHKVSGGCLHIKKLAEVDQDVLEALIENSLAFTRGVNGDPRTV
jgi:hypothetical protein